MVEAKSGANPALSRNGGISLMLIKSGRLGPQKYRTHEDGRRERRPLPLLSRTNLGD